MCVLAEVPAAAEVTTAEPAHVAAAEVAPASEASPAEATHMTATEAACVAEVSAGEMSPAAVEAEAMVKAVVEMVPSEEDRTPEAKAVIVIRIWVSVTIVVTRAVVRVVGAVWITGGGAADHSGRDRRSRIVAVIGIAVSVSPNIVAMTYVITCDIPVNAMCDTRMGRALVMVSDRRSEPVRVSDRRRICGGKR
jgi:hypothetical protein